MELLSGIWDYICNLMREIIGWSIAIIILGGAIKFMYDSYKSTN